MGFLFGLLNLQFDFIHRIWQTFLLEAADKWKCYTRTPAAMVQHASRTAEAAEVSISIEAVLATTRVFLCGKMFHLLHHLFYPGIIQLNLRVMMLWPRRSRPCRRRCPFYTLVTHTCWHTPDDITHHIPFPDMKNHTWSLTRRLKTIPFKSYDMFSTRCFRDKMRLILSASGFVGKASACGKAKKHASLLLLRR